MTCCDSKWKLRMACTCGLLSSYNTTTTALPKPCAHGKCIGTSLTNWNAKDTPAETEIAFPGSILTLIGLVWTTDIASEGET